VPTAKIKQFDFGGHSVKAVFKDLPGDHSMLLNNYLGVGARMNGGRSEPGNAQAATLMGGLKRIEVDGEEIPLTSRKNPLPLYPDHQKKCTLFEYVLGMVVQNNPQERLVPRVLQRGAGQGGG